MAVCVTSGGLTQDHRGEPVSWATCTGGQLAWKEFGQCRGKRAFEDNCFGKGNDLRKFVESMGVKVLPNRVVADVVTAQIRIAEFYVKGAEDVLTGVDHLAGDVGNEIDGLARRGDAIRDRVQTPIDCAR